MNNVFLVCSAYLHVFEGVVLHKFRSPLEVVASGVDLGLLQRRLGGVYRHHSRRPAGGRVQGEASAVAEPSQRARGYQTFYSCLRTTLNVGFAFPPTRALGTQPSHRNRRRGGARGGTSTNASSAPRVFSGAHQPSSTP